MSRPHSFRLEEAILSLLRPTSRQDADPGSAPGLPRSSNYFTSILRWRESLAAWVKRRRAWRTKLDFVWKSGN